MSSFSLNAFENSCKLRTRGKKASGDFDEAEFWWSSRSGS